MNTVAFDTLKMARRLEAGGFSAQQAESAAEAFAEVVQSVPTAVTVHDLDRLEAELKSRMTAMAAELTSEVAAMAAELRSEMAAMAAELRSEMAAMAAGLRSEMATKRDLEKLGTELRAEIAELGTQLRAEMAELGTQLRAEMATKLDIQTLRAEHAETKAEILKWMFGAMAAQVGVIVALLKLLP